MHCALDGGKYSNVFQHHLITISPLSHLRSLPKMQSLNCCMCKICGTLWWSTIILCGNLGVWRSASFLSIRRISTLTTPFNIFFNLLIRQGIFSIQPLNLAWRSYITLPHTSTLATNSLIFCGTNHDLWGCMI